MLIVRRTDTCTGTARCLPVMLTNPVWSPTPRPFGSTLTVIWLFPTGSEGVAVNHLSLVFTTHAASDGVPLSWKALLAIAGPPDAYENTSSVGAADNSPVIRLTDQ